MKFGIYSFVGAGVGQIADRRINFILQYIMGNIFSQRLGWIVFVLLFSFSPLWGDELEDLRDVIVKNTVELPENLGSERLSEKEKEPWIAVFDASEKILAEDDITQEFRIWTLQRRGIALVVLAYEETVKYFPILLAEVDELEGKPGCEKIRNFAELHVLKIASVLAVQPLKKPDGKKLSIALGFLTDWLLDYARRHPGKESDGLIRSLWIRVDQMNNRSERNRCQTIIAAPFGAYFEASGDKVFARQLQAVARKIALPGKTLKWNVVRLDGKPFDAESLVGKVVLVDFWGTWCIPCREETPELIALYEKYRSKGFEIVGVNTGTQGDQKPGVVKRYVEEIAFDGKKISWPIVLDGASTEPDAIKMSEYYGIEMLPEKILIGRDGKVVKVNPLAGVLDLEIQNALYPKVELTEEEQALIDAAKKREDEKLKKELEELGIDERPEE